MYNHKGNGPPGFNKPPQNKEGGSSTSQEDTNAAIFQLFKNQQASISNLTTQLGHVAKALSERPKDSLPANTEVNPKGPEELMMVTLRSGKQFQDATPKVIKEQRLMKFLRVPIRMVLKRLQQVLLRSLLHYNITWLRDRYTEAHRVFASKCGDVVFPVGCGRCFFSRWRRRRFFLSNGGNRIFLWCVPFSLLRNMFQVLYS
ncbi:hypothetical protein LINPERHAP2_LOCUS16247 [Linum perenne]